MDAIVEQEKAASTRIRRNEGVRVQGFRHAPCAVRCALCISDCCFIILFSHIGVRNLSYNSIKSGHDFI